MEDYSSITISMLVLLPLVAVFAVLGNGFVLGIIARFKKVRTFPNILIANLALIDFLNALINVPMYVLWGILSVEWFTGKTLAIISLFVSRLFILLNVASLLVLLLNVFLAIKLDLKYFIWKTNDRAMKIVLVEWIVCVIAAVLLSWSDSDIDLQDASVFRYRRAILIKSKNVLAAILAVFIFSATAFGILAFCSIQGKKRQRKRLNLPRLQAQARLQLDIQAVKTVIITVLAFLVCYIPPVCIGLWIRPETDDTTLGWPGHGSHLGLFLSSGINPVIYGFRARRFPRALKQLLQDPCGKAAFRETDRGQRVKQNVPYMDASEVSKGNKIASDLGEFIHHPAARSSKSYTSEMGLRVRSCEKEGISENTGKERGTRSRNQTMPFSSQDAEPQITSRLAWVDNHPTDTAGTRSGEESPTCSEDYTQHEGAVEVHPEPNDRRSSIQKSSESPATPSYSSTRKEVSEMVHSDTRDNKSNQKTIASSVGSVDYNGEVIVQIYTDPMGKISSPIMMDSPTVNADNAKKVIVDVNKSPKDDPSNQKIEESPTAYAEYARHVTLDPKDKPPDQKIVESPPGFLDEVFV